MQLGTALVVRHLAVCLLSPVQAAEQKRAVTTFGPGYFRLTIGDSTINGRPHPHTRTCAVRVHEIASAIANVVVRPMGNRPLFHEHACHINADAIAQAVRLGTVTIEGVEATRILKQASRRCKCAGCDVGKATARRHEEAQTDYASLAPLDLVVADLCGDLHKGANNDAYMLTVVDAATRYVEVVTIPDKRVAAPELVKINLKWQNFHNRKARSLLTAPS